jgi:RNA-binding protein
MTGKQRSFLKKKAHHLDPIFNIGKGGISDNQVEAIDQALEKRELIKIKLLQNVSMDTNEAADFIVEKLKAEFVQAIGSVFTIYRESKEDPKIELPKK